MTEPTILDEAAVSEIEARANAATDGPWTWTYHPDTPVFPDDVIALASDRAEKDVLLCTGNDDGSWGEISEPDAAFIEHAREDIPALCATVKHLRAENEDIKNQKWTAERVIAWLDDPNPQPAIHAFTAGNERQIAYRVERIRDDLQSQLEQLRAEVAEYERTDLVPRSRYNVADAEAREAREQTKQLAHRAGEEIESLQSQLEQLRAENGRLREQVVEAEKAAERWFNRRY